MKVKTWIPLVSSMKYDISLCVEILFLDTSMPKNKKRFILVFEAKVDQDVFSFSKYLQKFDYRRNTHSAFTTIASFMGKIRIDEEKDFSVSDYFFQCFRWFGLMRVLFGFGFFSKIKWSTGMRNTFKSAVGDMSHCPLRVQPTHKKNRVSFLGFAVRDSLLWNTFTLKRDFTLLFLFLLLSNTEIVRCFPEKKEYSMLWGSIRI